MNTNKINNFEKILQKIKKNPEIANTLSAKQLVKFLKKSSEAYYNTGISIISDKKWDIVKDIFVERFPDHKYIQDIGAPIKGKNKVELPYWCGSMDKIKPFTKKVEKWIPKYSGPYVISDKLDGVSALYVITDVHYKTIYVKNKKVNIKKYQRKLYSRGNGKVGQDITGLLPYLNLPKVKGNCAIRGELIVSKKNFLKFKDVMKNARNMVSGVVNSKTINVKIAKYIDFVAYEFVHPRFKPSTQFNKIKNMKFKVATNSSLKKINEEILIDILKKRKNDTDYEIDGIIIADDNLHILPKSGNPKYAFAFKMEMDEQIKRTEVLDVIWTASKGGLLKPRIKVKPVFISGCKIQFITGNNAKFIVQNNIGPGAVLDIIRSGDVIPKVKKVIKTAEVKYPTEDYIWNDTKVEFILKNISNSDTVQKKRILAFFKTCEVANVSTGMVNKLFENNYTKLIDILNATKTDIKKIPGLEHKMGDIVFNSIHNTLKNIPVETLLSALPCIGSGFGKKKLKPLIAKFPNLLEKTPSIEEVMTVEGYSDKSAKKIVKLLPKCKIYIDNLPKWINISFPKKEDKKKIKGKLYGQIFVFSGVRNKDVEKWITDNDGTISNNISSKTTMLIVKDINAKSSKIKKAKDKNIKVVGIDEFI